MNRTKIFGYAALAILIASLLVHYSTFLPWTPVSMSRTWPLHVLTMAAFGMMLFDVNIRQKQAVGAGWRHRKQTNKWLGEVVSRTVPKWLLWLFKAAVVYTAVDFFLCQHLMENGGPLIVNGAYTLSSNGRKIRDLTKEEYDRMIAYEARLFSGGWIVFSLVPAAYFLVVAPQISSVKPKDVEES